MANEEDPKEAAKQELRKPEVQRMLRQFVNTDGPKGNSNKFKQEWERIFGGKEEPVEEPTKQCLKCFEFVAANDTVITNGDRLCVYCAAEE